MDSAPLIPTNVDAHEQVPDLSTQGLNELLNSYDPITLTTYVRSTRYAMGINDYDYNVGYHQVAVDNQVGVLAYHYEAPEIEISDISKAPKVLDSTLVYKQVGDRIIVPMRAPDINEGF